MYILFDIGGTKMRFSLSLDMETFIEPVRRETPKTFEEGIVEIEKIGKELCGGKTPLSVVGGIAGPLNTEHSMLLNAPNLPLWQGKPLKRELKRIFKTDVHIENDSALGGLGEAHYGAGKGIEIVAYVTVSTGVGGARIVNGVIDKNRFGFEPGHQIISVGGAHCLQCSGEKIENVSVGKLRDVISGAEVERRFGKKPYDIPQDDPLWGTLARLLAVGLNNSIVHWSPDVIVLGGSMITGNPAILLSDIERHVNEIVNIFPKKPLFKMAELKDVGGLYGALALLKQKRQSILTT